MVRIVSEIGSTHMGKIEYAKEAIDRCCDMGVDAIKFQLFPNKSPWVGTGNVWLAPDLYLEIAEYSFEQGLDCSASVFDEASFEFLMKTKPPFMKFSFSKKDETGWIYEALSEGIESIVSCDVMSDHAVPLQAKKLFCLPHYPVYHFINFDQIFPRFYGFSDHTLGFDQTIEAVESGAQLIEKHMTLDHSDVTCPDSYFALKPKEMARMVSHLRKIA